MTLKKIQREIQKLKDAKSSKKHKKSKKHKFKRSRSRSNSVDSRHSSDSRRHHRSKHADKKHSSEYERLKQEVAALKSGRKEVKLNEAKNELGPDMTIYGNRQREIEETERLKKAQRHETHKMT